MYVYAQITNSISCNVGLDPITLESIQKMLQAQIDYKICSSLKSDCSLRDCARLSTISSTHAGAWIKAIPNEKLGLYVS